MKKKNADSTTPWVDPDDAPELTDDWFAEADLYDGARLIRRGRPRMESPKKQVTARLDADLLEAMKATGKGWQTRMNAALRREFVDGRRIAPPSDKSGG